MAKYVINDDVSGVPHLSVEATKQYDRDGFVDFEDDKGLVLRVAKDRVVTVKRVD